MYRVNTVSLFVYERQVNLMKAYNESMYWMENEAWFRINSERDCMELTPEAPPRAVESFRLYLLRNDLPVDEGVIPGERYVPMV